MRKLGPTIRKLTRVPATRLRVQERHLEQMRKVVRRQSQSEVEAGTARHSDLYEHGPFALMTLDPHGVIRQVNRMGARLFGIERSGLVGTPLKQLIAADDRPTFDAFISKMFESKTEQDCEIEMHSGLASPPFVEFVGVVVNEGQECRIVARDVTIRKREQERVELRSQLAKARRLEAVGTLAGGIAHDINNILGGILGGLSLLEGEPGESSEHHSHIQDIEALVRRGASLTKQLLGFACGSQRGEGRLDLADAVRETCAMFGCTRKDISIQIEVAPGLRAVLMDHTQFEQVLLNLLVNAGQAMPEGGELHLNAKNVTRPCDQSTPPGAIRGQFVKLDISDTGIGMDAATQSRIFEPFFTTKGPGKGTGLGLASVHGIIKSHSGIISVQSELGRGTTFSLVLPAAQGPSASERHPASPIQHGTGTILVVDDEAQMLRVYSRLLRKMGYSVLAASSGKQALELLTRHRNSIDLVILDMIMPDMHGHKTYDAMREIEPSLNALVCTGSSIDGKTQEILARGYLGIIQKPFDAATLSAALRKILGVAPVAARAADVSAE